MCTYKPHRIVHNAIGVAEALTALPLLAASISVVASAETAGSPGCQRRLLLGLAAASVWLAVAAAFSPAFTAAVVRTVDPVVYPRALRAVAPHPHGCAQRHGRSRGRGCTAQQLAGCADGWCCEHRCHEGGACAARGHCVCAMA